MAVEAALDLCNHLCAKRLHKAPTSYADCFTLLAQGGVIRPETAARLVPMVRFRNLLVHQYGDVDHRRLYRILHEHLGDLDQYLAEVAQYLGQEL